jgi:hypothetical protein
MPLRQIRLSRQIPIALPRPVVANTTGSPGRGVQFDARVGSPGRNGGKISPETGYGQRVIKRK